MQAEAIAAIEKLTAVLQSHEAALQEYLAFEHAKRHQSDWMTAEEVALEFGLPDSGTKYYRRKIMLTAQQYGVRYMKNRPTVYWREDIYELSRKIKEGKAVLISPA